MLLLIPGPVTTHPDVRQALACDVAPWDNEFRALYAGVLHRLLPIAEADADTHAVLALQGSGHMVVEAAIRTFVPHGGTILIPATGAYADRMTRLAREAGRVVIHVKVAEGERTDPELVAAALRAHPEASHLGAVYSETGSGVIHDVPALAAVAGAAGRRVLVDAVSAFGIMKLPLRDLPMVDAAMFTSNKGLEAPPGLGFAAARIDRLRESAGRAQSWSLDLADIYAHGLRSPGSFRFTPPGQVLVALDVALGRFEAEGRAARHARYTANMRTLYDGVCALGLRPCLAPAVQGPVVVNVHAPDGPAWDLQAFVDALKRRGVLISNFYNTRFPSFRVGCIGAVRPTDMHGAVGAIGEAMAELGVTLRRAA
ncbi:MAG: 2-aminoethylphosphonate--pyruvate transaminase [Acetobacteraceae bacterium]